MKPNEEHVLCAFVERFYEDEESGTRRTLADYLALYPGYDERIASEYLELVRGNASSDDAQLESEERNDDLGSVGPFALQRLLGRGGQADVWLAEDSRLARTVALKVFRETGGSHDEILARFRREATIAATLDDPGICPVYEVGVDGVPWIAMRYVEGVRLADLIVGEEAGDRSSGGDEADSRPASDDKGISDTPRLESRESILGLFTEIARSLHVAHEIGVIHRDIKPANVMVEPSGRPVILDFGIARIMDAVDATLTRSGEVVGTPAYMAPEQLKGEVPDRRTDVYALGVTLFEALTGHRPFAGTTVESTHRAILEETPPTLRSFDVHASNDLEAVLSTALAKERHRRYASALAFADDLRRLAAKEPVRARRAGRIERLWMQVRRRPTAAALILTLVIGVPALSATSAYIFATREDVVEQERLKREQRTERLLASGMDEFRLADRDRGLQLLEQVHAEDPSSMEARAILAWCLAQSEESQRALELIDGDGRLGFLRRRIVPDVSTEADGEAPLEPRPTQAFEHYLDGITLLYRSRAGVIREDAELAVSRLRASALLSPEPRLMFLVAYARALDQVTKCGGEVDPYEVRTVAATLTTYWPEHFAATYRAAQLMRHEEPALADEAMLRAIALAPGRRKEGLELERLDMLVQTGRYDDALQVTAELLARPETEIGRARLLIGDGRVGLLSGNYEMAERRVREGLELDPNHVEGLEILSLTLEQTGRADEAIDAARRVAELAPTAKRHAQVARLLDRYGRQKEAFAPAREAVAASRERGFREREVLADCHALLAIEALMAKDRARALEQIDQALELAPDRVEYWRRKLIYHWQLKQHKPARVAGRKVMSLDPEDPTSMMLTAMTMMRSSEETEAFQLLSKAHPSQKILPAVRDLVRREVSVAFHLSLQALAKAGENEKVRDLVRRTPEVYPDPYFRWFTAMILVDIPQIGGEAQGVSQMVEVLPEAVPLHVQSTPRLARKLHDRGKVALAIELMDAVVQRLERDNPKDRRLRRYRASLSSWRKSTDS